MALFSSFYVSVATKCDVIAVYLVYSVKNIFAFCDFSQYDIADFWGADARKYRNVASAFKKWAHAVSLCAYGYFMPLVDKFAYVGQEFRV